jgi:RecJ-like exonuclease
LFINDVPTIMDEGGNIKKRENFEWYFECKTQTVRKEDKKTYTYETKLIETKRCDKCSGTGTDPQIYKCSSCNGTGQTKNMFDGKMYTCYTCKGNGTVRYKCPDCGGAGTFSFPKSQPPRVKESVTWSGYPVDIKTIPSGASVKIIGINSGEYFAAGTTPSIVNWYSTSGKTCPIILELDGKVVKVQPTFNAKGKKNSFVTVDFTKGTPLVTGGTKVE